jgi:hypothetical protein
LGGAGRAAGCVRQWTVDSGQETHELWKRVCALEEFSWLCRIFAI